MKRENLQIPFNDATAITGYSLKWVFYLIVIPYTVRGDNFRDLVLDIS